MARERARVPYTGDTDQCRTTTAPPPTNNTHMQDTRLFVRSEIEFRTRQKEGRRRDMAGAEFFKISRSAPAGELEPQVALPAALG